MENLAKSMLIIGGSGFIGKALVPAMLKEGFNVTVLNRGTTKIKGVRQWVADRNNLKLMETVCESMEPDEVFDVVIDTSAYNGYQVELAWKCFGSKTKHWVHLSSAAVYLETNEPPVSEAGYIGGAEVWGTYGVDKSSGDQFLLEINEGDSPVSLDILRPPYLYGPANDSDRETFVWSRCLNALPVVIPGNGETLIQFLHVDDLVSAMLAAINQPSGNTRVFNVAESKPVSLAQWVATVADVAGKANPGWVSGISSGIIPPRRYFPFRDTPCYLNVDRIKKELGWEPSFELKQGLAQTFASYDIDDLTNRSLDRRVEQSLLDAHEAEALA